MVFLVQIHSILRWIIVIVGLVAIIKFLVGWLRKSAFSQLDRRLSAGFSGLMDLQAGLGIVIFLIINFSGMGFSVVRMAHVVTMLLAVVAGHAPSMFKKAGNKFAVALGAVVVAMLLVYFGVLRLSAW